MFRVNDLGLVTWLVYRSHIIQKTSVEGRSCWWYFERTDQLSEDVLQWNDSTAEVNIREYNRMYAAVKRDLHRLIPRPS